MAFSARGRRRGFCLLTAVLAALLWPVAALAHVGSPDIYAEGNAGPYRLLVTVRPPQVIPGVAEIEVRAVGAGSLSGIAIAPIPLTGEASLHPPAADAMKQSAADKSFFTGSLWIMASGSWQVRFTAQGSQGQGVLSIPVPATSSATMGMQAGMGILLGAFGLLLVVGAVGIVGAAAREAQLEPGRQPQPASRRRAQIAMGAALALTILAVVGGRLWWDSEAEAYGRYVYKPLTMLADEVRDPADGGRTLHLKLFDPGWLKTRRLDDFVLDHDHLMHLYLIRQPGLDVVYHLHPTQVASGEFDLPLPTMPAGDYRLYADVVHSNGFPETLVARLALSSVTGRALTGDDAEGIASPVSPPRGESASCAQLPGTAIRSPLPDGYAMVWNNPAPQPAKTPQVFEFSLLDPDGRPAQDMALYMGMVGHAAFVKDDGAVFAHVHPSGTVSMAALTMAAAQNPAGVLAANAMAAMPGMENSNALLAARTARVPSTASFPYGFPSAGAYRIFVQMKHGSTVETGIFDACATSPQSK